MNRSVEIANPIERKGRVAIKLTTNEGKVYDLGCVEEGDIASFVDHFFKVRAYASDRKKTITDPRILKAFKRECRRSLWIGLRKAMKGAF